MSADGATDAGPVAIICGGGTFPATVADAVMRQGRRAVLFPLRGFADAALVERFPHHWIKIGQVGAFVKLARSEGVRDVVMIGSLVRPAISQLALDWKTLLVLPRVVRAYYGGDDHLLLRMDGRLRLNAAGDLRRDRVGGLLGERREREGDQRGR